MAERVETIRLTAQVSNYIAGMEAAQKATLATASAAQKVTAQGQSFTSLGHTLLAFGAVVAAGVAVAVKSFAEFDAKQSQVQSLSHATAEEMGQLGEAALTLGQKIGISATEAADAEIELVKAGVAVADIMGGALKGSLELAAAGQIDVADATAIATIALTQFGLAGEDVPHVADLLAAGADKALGGVQDLGEALKSGGLVAAQFGVSLEETVGTLSAFANAGLLGETAGTDLRQMLLKLADPSAETAALMKNLGINIYDTSGQFIGIAGLAGQLKSKLGDLSEAQRNQALSMIFGSRAIAGANVLFKEGAEGISKWTADVDDAGFAAQQAAGKMDNLEGDLSKLTAAINSDFVESGSAANDLLRSMVQTLTVLAEAFGSLPAPVQGATLAVGAIVAAMALAAGVFLTLVPRIAATKDAMLVLGLTMRGTAVSAGLVGGALGLLTLVFSLYAAHQAEATQGAEDFQSTLDEQTGAITNNTRAMVAKKLADSGAFDIGKKLGYSQQELTDAVLAGGDALDEVSGKFSDYANFQALAAGENPFEAAGTAQSLGQINDQLGNGIQKFKDQKVVQDDSTTSTEEAADAYRSAAEQANNLTDQISQLTDTINLANGVGQDAVSTNASYQKALADAAEYAEKARQGVEGYTLGLDEATVAGSTNAATLAELAKKGQDAAKAQYDLDQNTDTYIQRLKDTRQDVIDNALAMGATAEQAQAIADKVAAIPSEKEVKILVDTAAASHSLDAWIARQTGRSIPVYIDPSGRRGVAGNFASGGMISGPGSGTSDSIPANLSNGEFVTTAAATSKNRGVLEFINAGGVVSGYADGGYVTPRYMTAPSSAAANFNVVIQPKGGVNLLEYVDVQIQQHETANAVDYQAGGLA